MPGTTIVVVEDEQEIRDMLSFALERAGYSVVAVETAEVATAQLDLQRPDLLIIDWMLPGMSGLDFARQLRQDQLTADIPLIMLTARSEEADKLKSFAAGVDDHITKPFSPRELLARVKAILRRSGTPEDGLLESGTMRLDTRSHRLFIENQPVHLGPTEFRLLRFLMRQPDRTYDRGQLLDRVWGRSVYVEERTVDVHIQRLRKALAPYGLDQRVQTVRGVGYRFSQHH